MQKLIKLLTFFVFFLPSAIMAISPIRDAEIEAYIKEIADPILIEAGLNPESVDIYILNDKTINAFVTGGQKMFLHTALITKSENPTMLIGVIAHEAGHIAGGDLVQLSGEVNKAIIQSTLGSLIGLATVLAGGSSDAGMAVAATSNRVAERKLLSFSRQNEEIADQNALKYMKNIGISPQGLLDLLGFFRNRQSYFANDIDPYALTHPLSQVRLDNIKNFIKKNPELNNYVEPEIKDKHLRTIAKIEGFLSPTKDVFGKYQNNSFYDLYARAVALHRIAEFDRSIKTLDRLLKQKPNDVYLHELKGQIEFENGRITDSVNSYTTAQKILPENALINIGLAKSLLALDEDNFYDNDLLQIKYKQAIEHLDIALVKEPKNALAWRNMAIAYGRVGLYGDSYYASAEYNASLKKHEKAEEYIKLASKFLKKSSKNYTKLQDLKKFIEDED